MFQVKEVLTLKEREVTMEKIVNGIKFTNIVDDISKEKILKSTYAQNQGKPYSFENSLAGSESYFKRNLDAIRGAFTLLQGK